MVKKHWLIWSNLINYDGNMYLTNYFLIEKNNIITVSNNIILRKFNINPHGFDKMYMDKDLLEDLSNNRLI